MQMLDNLLDIEVAYSLLRGGNEDGDKDPIDINYEKLRTDIKVKKKKVTDQECMLMSCWSVNRSAKLKVDRCIGMSLKKGHQDGYGAGAHVAQCVAKRPWAF